MKNSSLTWKQKYEIASRHFSGVFFCSALNVQNIFHSICLASAFRFHGTFFFDEHLNIWCDPNKIPVKLLEFYSFACDVIEIFTYFIRCVGETNITIWLTNKILWNEDKKNTKYSSWNFWRTNKCASRFLWDDKSGKKGICGMYLLENGVFSIERQSHFYPTRT